MTETPKLARFPRPTTGGAFVVAVTVATAIWAGLGGLDFLNRPTGWQMGFSLVSQTPSDPYWRTIGIAVGNTVLVAAISIVIATIAGSLVAIVSIGQNPVWSRMAKVYVQLFRNMPLILQALFWFAMIAHASRPRDTVGILGFFASNRGLAMPWPTATGLAITAIAIGAFVLCLLLLTWTRFDKMVRLLLSCLFSLAIVGLLRVTVLTSDVVSVPVLQGFNFSGGLQLPTEFLAIMLALSMFGSAYIAEIVRGGFQTVPKGVIEAGRALALPDWIIEVRIRIPIALRAILLPLGSQYTVLVKATAIGLAVGFTDLFAVTIMSINQSGQTIDVVVPDDRDLRDHQSGDRVPVQHPQQRRRDPEPWQALTSLRRRPRRLPRSPRPQQPPACCSSSG